MVKTRGEIEAEWRSEGRYIVFEDGDCQTWADSAEEELFFVNWATEILKVYKLVDKYQKKTETS